MVTSPEFSVFTETQSTVLEVSKLVSGSENPRTFATTRTFGPVMVSVKADCVDAIERMGLVQSELDEGESALNL